MGKDLRDRDVLPSLPSVPWGLVSEKLNNVPMAVTRLIWERSRNMVNFIAALSTGSVNDEITKRPSWESARPLQRKVVTQLAETWIAWAPFVQETPSASVAASRLLGTNARHYANEMDVAASAEPDSRGRERKPKGAVVPLDVEELSLPDPGTDMIELVGVSSEVTDYFNKFEKTMLRDEESLDLDAMRVQKTYMDPSLKEKAKRLRLAERLWQAGALGYTDRCVDTLSLFGVIKKYTEKGERVLRPVWDQRRPNMRWKPPPFVPLGSPASFVNLDLADMEADDALVSVGGDIPDFFTRCKTPRKVWPYFVLEGVEVHEFVTHMRKQGHVMEDSPITAKHLAVTVLVMGWSWAPYLAHMTLIAALDMAHGPSSAVTRMVYGTPCPQLHSAQHPDGQPLVSWGYIDDYGAATTQSAAAVVNKEPNQLMQEWGDTSKKQLGKIGFPVHKEVMGEGVEALGARVRGRPYVVGVPEEKVCLLVAATEHMMTMRSITKEDLERLVGLWGWVCLFARCSYSVLDVTYHQMRENNKSGRIIISNGMRQELRCLAAIAPLVVTNLETPWHLKAFATDASMTGYGVTHTPASVTELRDEARHCELRGWTVCVEDSYAQVEESIWQDEQSKYEEGSGPDPDQRTESPLPTAFDPPTPGRVSASRRRGDRVLAPPLASSWTREERWATTFMGTWETQEHINVQEARTVVSLMRHLARTSQAWGSRVLVLTDSMVTLGCLSKGRSSASPLLRLCRMTAAITLSLRIRLLLRYIPSEMNPADGPSRGMKVGAAPETIAAHADRKIVKDELPDLRVASMLELLKPGTSCSGSAGG
jgi:hypothetical protein